MIVLEPPLLNKERAWTPWTCQNDGSIVLYLPSSCPERSRFNSHILIYDGPSLDYPSVSSPSTFRIGSLPRAPMIGPSCLPRQDQSTATRIRGPSELLCLVLPSCPPSKPKSKWSHLWSIKSRRIVLAFGKAQSGNAMECRKTHQHEPL